MDVSGGATPGLLEFRVLGPLEVSANGHALAIAGSRQRGLLAFLLLHANAVVSSERLIDELFGDEPPENALNSVHAGISRLRRQLAAAAGAERALRTRAPGYLLELDPGQLDLARYELLLEQGRRELVEGATEEAAETLRAALALRRGPALADLSGYAFARREAARIDELHVAGTMDRIDADLALGRHSAVIPELERLVVEQPFLERFRGQLMLALYRAGRQADALRAYQEARNALQSELGLEPGKQLRDLERAILEHDPALESPQPRERPGVRTPRRLRPATVLAAVAVVATIAGVVAAVAMRPSSSEAMTVTPNSVVAVHAASKRVTASIPVGESPQNLLSAAGSVWAINGEDSTISRIDPAREVVLRTIPLGGRPSDVASDGDRVWVLYSDDPTGTTSSGSVALVDPEFNSVARMLRGVSTVGVVLDDPVVAHSGSLWIGGPNGLVQVAATTGRVGGRLDPGPVWDLAVDGRTLWAAHDGGVSEIDAVAGDLLATLELSTVTVPIAVAVAEGSVWVLTRPGFSCCPAQDLGVGTLFRLDPETHEIVATVRIGGHPSALAAGEEGVWVTDGDGALLRVDPRTNEISDRIPIDGIPSGVAVAEQKVWVSVS